MRNRGDLAEGWYEPTTKDKADAAHNEELFRDGDEQSIASSHHEDTEHLHGQEQGNESEDDTFGPPLPGELVARKAAGPAMPSMQDLDLRRGLYLFICANGFLLGLPELI